MSSQLPIEGTAAKKVALQPLYGLMAEFRDEHELVAATRAAYEQGYRKMEAYTPFFVEELAEILGVRGRRLPLIVLAGGIIGGGGGLLMQWFSATIHYPLNIGGRPYASWPTFIPVSFELTILLAGIFGLLGMFALNGLPEPYHPVFNVPRFTQASRDRFFLCIESRDPHFDLAQTRQFMEGLRAQGVYEVEP
ncbi:MAG: DUF3341 domain-containing protein [Chloroflexi bacterium]|nr:DUF3341 domain-containing protein [Chloroflexota bacterium]